MSKFRTRIRDVGRAPGGFGFAALARRERPRYVVVIAEAGSAADAQQAVAAGADGVVFTGGIPSSTGLSVPLGVRLDGASRADVLQAQQAGADFIVFDDALAQAGALSVDDIGFVLVLGDDRDEERLRMIAAVELDAILVEAQAEAMTVRQQLELRRVAAYGGAPLLVRANGRVDTSMLEAWRDAGAPAVLVPARDVAVTLEAAMQVSAPRRSERRLPMLGATTVAEHDHDHDHDDD